MMDRYIKDKNIIIGKYDLIPFVETISKDAIVLGQTNTLLLERNCILMNKDDILKDGLLRIEFKDNVLGAKIGYLEVGYNEYVELKSVGKLWISFIYMILFVLVILNIVLLFWRC